MMRTGVACKCGTSFKAIFVYRHGRSERLPDYGYCETCKKLYRVSAEAV